MIARAVMLCLLPFLAGMAGAGGAESGVTAPTAPPPGQAAPDPVPQAETEPGAIDATRECSTCAARHRSLQRLQEELAAPGPE